MVAAWLLAVALQGDGMTPLDQAIERYSAVSSYRVNIRSVQAGAEQSMHYAYRKPGFVRLEFVRPHRGALLVYDPQADRVHLWPFGWHHFPEMNLRPDNPLIRGSSGQRVDHSDVGTLFESVRALSQGGNVSVSDEVDVRGRRVWHLDVTGPSDVALSGVHRYELWLEQERLLPLQVVSHDAQDQTIETVYMEDWEVGVPLPDALFHPD